MWISVEERLPRGGKPVLAVHQDGDTVLVGVYSTGSHNWYRYTGSMIPPEMRAPTHWMPLPEPPGLSEQGHTIDWYTKREFQALANRVLNLETTVAALDDIVDALCARADF